jgi:hypothetical protein
MLASGFFIETKKLVDDLANNEAFIKIIQAELDNIELNKKDKDNGDDASQLS